MKPAVLVLAGPTAVGKSRLALELARQWRAEIVSADARQVYRGLDCGTAKPDTLERAEVPHHLIDICDPTEQYSAARFLRDASEALSDVTARGRRAIVVGGTGLYLKVLQEGLFAAPTITPETRLRVDHMLTAGGRESLEQYLREHDPVTHAVVDRANTARLRRAVEHHLQTRESLELTRQQCISDRPPFRFYAVVLVRPRAQLYDIIEDRVEAMLAAGWLEEVRALARRWDFGLPAFNAVGYRELYDVIKHRVSLEEARRLIVRQTRRYAKRQLTWFSHQGSWLWMSPEMGVTAKITSGFERFAETKSA